MHGDDLVAVVVLIVLVGAALLIGTGLLYAVVAVALIALLLLLPFIAYGFFSEVWRLRRRR